MTEKDAFRQWLFDENRQRLAELAYRALRRGMKPVDFIIICIDVEDSEWTELVNHLMPDHDWQSIRDRGERPVARGSVTREVAEYLSKVAPAVASALSIPPPCGQVLTAVLGAGGVSIYFVKPQPDPH